MEGIRIVEQLIMSLSENLKISRCYVENLRADTTHYSTLIEDCAIKNDFSLPNGINQAYRRSEIERHHLGNTPENMAIFDYCTILNPLIEQVDITYSKGVKHWHKQLGSYGTYLNCAIYSSLMESGQSTAQAPLYLNQQSDYHDFLIFGGMYGSVAFVIRDGTIAEHVAGKFMDDVSGIKNDFPSFYTDYLVIPQENGMEYTAPVGCIGHREWPRGPRIIESNIDRETDSNGNLNISIKVLIED